MREEFYKLPKIAELINKGAWWCNENSYYDADYEAEITVDELRFMDGAWYVFQELNK